MRREGPLKPETAETAEKATPLKNEGLDEMGKLVPVRLLWTLELMEGWLALPNEAVWLPRPEYSGEKLETSASCFSESKSTLH